MSKEEQSQPVPYIPDLLDIYDKIDEEDAVPGLLNTSPFDTDLVDQMVDPRSGVLLSGKNAPVEGTFQSSVTYSYDQVPAFFGISTAGFFTIIISALIFIFGVFSFSPIILFASFPPLIVFTLLFFRSKRGLDDISEIGIFVPAVQVEAKMFVPVQIKVTSKSKVYGKLTLDVSDGLFPVYLPNVSIFHIPKGGGTVTRTFLFYAPARGKEIIRRIQLEINGIPGLFYVHKAVVPLVQIVVLPEPQRVQLPWSLKQKILDQFISEISVPQRGSGSDFLSLKDFEFGDEIRNIAWKATAKYNKLISKEFEEPRQLRFLIVLDCSLMVAGPKLEFIFSSAVELAKALRRTEHSTHVLAIGHRELKKISVGVSPATIRRLGIELHSIIPEGTEFNYDAMFRSIMVNKLYDTVVILLTDVEMDPQTIKLGLVKIRPYVQRIFLFACNTPAFGTLWLERSSDATTYDVDEVEFRRSVLEPTVRRTYLVKVREMRKAVVAAGAWFHLIDGYNTNILLELKKAMDLSGKKRRTR